MGKAKGNMYSWVTHTANPLAGECKHNCSYCYVNKLKKAKPAIFNKYSGLPRISENGLKDISGKGKFIFVCDMTDLFAEDVKYADIEKILNKCREKDGNKYLFQTKNPLRVMDFRGLMPKNSIISTTIETNRWYNQMGNAPSIYKRMSGLHYLHLFGFDVYVTIEPIMDFDGVDLFNTIVITYAKQVSIGADSGGNNLPEPGRDKILELISGLEKFTIVKQKTNLKRLL